METSRRNALKRLGSALLVGLSPLSVFSSAPKNRSFTGEEMYRGIFFAEGEFARLIPEMQSLKAAYALAPASNGQAEDVRRQLINHLKQTDGAFFIKFKAALMSQDVLCVQRQLQTASERTARSLDKLYNSPANQTSDYQLKKRVMESGQGVVLLVANAVACVNVIYILCASSIEELSVVRKASPLLIEQIAVSICTATREVA